MRNEIANWLASLADWLLQVAGRLWPAAYVAWRRAIPRLGFLVPLLGVAIMFLGVGHSVVLLQQWFLRPENSATVRVVYVCAVATTAAAALLTHAITKSRTTAVALLVAGEALIGVGVGVTLVGHLVGRYRAVSTAAIAAGVVAQLLVFCAPLAGVLLIAVGLWRRQRDASRGTRGSPEE